MELSKGSVHILSIDSLNLKLNKNSISLSNQRTMNLKKIISFVLQHFLCNKMTFFSKEFKISLRKIAQKINS